MEETIFENNKYLINKKYDEITSSPREEYDNLGIFLLQHRKYNMSFECDKIDKNIESLEQLVNEAIDKGAIPESILNMDLTEKIKNIIINY